MIILGCVSTWCQLGTVPEYDSRLRPVTTRIRTELRYAVDHLENNCAALFCCLPVVEEQNGRANLKLKLLSAGLNNAAHQNPASNRISRVESREKIQ